MGCNCEICGKSFVPRQDNKLVGLGHARDSWACDNCLTAESSAVYFVDDSGAISDSFLIDPREGERRGE